MPSRAPNFLFIGPDKAGSTWLYEALKRHDQVFLPPVKELFFFDQFYEKGWPWYRRYFKGAEERHRIVAEICHDYLASPLACERIARDLPSVKLMVCLREPVQRAFSAYLYLLKVGAVTSDFETALKTNHDLIDRGRYATHLARYLRHFHRGQIFVAIFDDLAASPQEFLNHLCDFLELDRLPLSSELEKQVLVAAKPKFRRAAKFARSIGWRIRRIGFPGLVGSVKESALVSRILYSPFVRNEQPQISFSTREYLREIFLPEIRCLDALLGTNLCERWGYSKQRKEASDTRARTKPAVSASDSGFN